MLNYKQINNRIFKYPLEEVVIYKYVRDKGATSYELFHEVNGEMKKKIVSITPNQVEYYTDRGHTIKTF